MYAITTLHHTKVIATNGYQAIITGIVLLQQQTRTDPYFQIILHADSSSL